MARFFFNVRYGSKVIADPEGDELVDLQAAQDEALKVARELIRELELADALGNEFLIEVVNDNDNVVLSLPVSAYHIP